ncbi:MAG TPA: signal peptide peptidase SppA [Flavobacteriaceae bacterium]|nr:signal peptide peptidase SppA [Flavobacteriaceae bacterium]
MKFLRNLFASIFGTIIALGIVLLIFIFIASIVAEAEKVTVKENSILVLDLSKNVRDYAPKSDDPFEELLGMNDENLGLNTILNAIENAKDDENIKGISIKGLAVGAGIAQTQAIRNKLKEFKESDKFIFSYADLYTQMGYYLSSVADEVYLNPFGGIEFNGLTSEVLFFKELEEKTGIQMEVIRHGKYKSAVEPFLYNEMSDENRQQITSFLNAIWGELVAEIAEDRNIAEAEVNTIATQLLTRNADLALSNNMIDAAMYKDEYVSKLKELTNVEEDDDLEAISLENYIKTGKGRLKSTGSDRIAVIYAQGEIIYGKGNQDLIGQDLIIDALKKARESKKTKAIVLRVDSPGGSALTSELIWREIELTKEELPVVVSMGNVAASGGYYIACNASKIYAEPTTITGSIGVFGILPNLHEFANDIGVNAEQVKTNNSPHYSLFEPMTDEFRSVTKEGVERVYETFLERVANGRNMSVEQVNEIAQGRVWAGTEAVKNGLVDELGSLEDAINYAAELTETTDYKVRNYPNYKFDLEDRLGMFPFAKTKKQLLIETLGEENYKLYNNIKSYTNQKGIQAKLPFIMEIN